MIRLYKKAVPEEVATAIADRAAQEAVVVTLRTRGDRHPDYVAALLTRAYAYQYSRAADESLQAAEEAYRSARAVFSDTPQHPRIIEGRSASGSSSRIRLKITAS